MIKVYRTLGFIAFMLNCLVSPAHGDLSAVTPASSTVSSCTDYFTSEWSNPLDMSDNSDILYNLVPRESQHLSTYSYSGGVFSTTTTGVDPYFRVLTWHDNDTTQSTAIPDDTTRFGIHKPINPASYPYNILTFRMYTDVASDFQVLWEKYGAWAITDPVNTYAGWRTYQIDLSAAPINQGEGNYSWSSGGMIGLRIDPNRNNSGASIKLDWMQLTPPAASCSSLNVGFTAASSDRVVVFVDDNTDPNDGYYERSDILSGSAGSTSFSANQFFPGSYNVYGFSTKDYATSHLNAWDMDDTATDVDSGRIYNITLSGNGFGSGKFCGTTNAADANFYLNLPDDSPIDASVFNKFRIGLELGAGIADQLVVNYFDTSGALKGSQTVNTNGSGTYSIDLSGAGGWSGQIGSFRINPVVFSSSSGRSFCVDYVTLGSEYLNAPSSPSLVHAASQVTFSKRYYTSFVQPDKEGGEDYFVAQRSNPSNMDSGSDLDLLSGLTSASIYPGNVYTDSGGAVKIGDYLQGLSEDGNDDPQNFSVFLDYARPIDPTKYKIACFTLDVLASSVSIYHSVARILWQVDSGNVNGDDLVLKTTGESRYCLRMDTLLTEPPLASGATHPWRKNSDGTGINFWRIDAHEESTATSFRFQDIRLAAEHATDQRFAVVLQDDRDAAVSVYYTSVNAPTAGTLIGTLSANRDSDVLLWNTSALAAGTYYLYANIAGGNFMGPSPVVVDHSAGVADTTAPILNVDAPLSGHRFSGNLELAGSALDNLRLATVEVLVDGDLVDTFRPSEFRKSVRDAYPNYPYSSSAAFQRYVNLSGLSDGSYTVEIMAYDTHGNSTTYSTNVIKTGTNLTAAIEYPVPSETPLALPVATSIPDPGSFLKMSVSLKGSSISFNVSGASQCSTLRVLGNYGANNSIDEIRDNSPVTLFTVNSGLSKAVKRSAANIKAYSQAASSAKKKKKKSSGSKIYFLADCGAGSEGVVKSIDAKKIKASKGGKSSNLKSILASIKSKLKKK